MLAMILSFLLLGSVVTSLPLEPLCPSDHFNYQGVRVNAIHRFQTNVTLEPVSEFVVLLFNNCLNYEWTFPQYKLQAERIKDDYNDVLIRVYSEQFLNSKDLDHKSFKRQLKEVNQKIARMEKFAYWESSSVKRCLEEKSIQTMKNGGGLIVHLASLYNEQLPQTNFRNLSLGKDNVFRLFKSEIDRIAKKLTNSQKMAFRFDQINEVYKKPIVRVGKFVFHQKSKVVFDSSSFGTLHFEIIFPFEDTELQARKDCVSSADLPRFFRNPKPAVTRPDVTLPPF